MTKNTYAVTLLWWLWTSPNGFNDSFTLALWYELQKTYLVSNLLLHYLVKFECLTVQLSRIEFLGTTVFRGTRNFEPSRRICQLPRNFYVFAEFCGIRYWSVIRGQIRHILAVFRWPYCMYTSFRHEIHDCWLGRNWKNVETVDLSLSEIFQVYLVDICICELQLPATSTAYLAEFRGHTKLITICGKFAAVSRRIWQTGPRNLEKFAAENCGP